MVQKQVTLWLSGQAFFLEMKNVCRLPTLGLFKEPSHQEEADVYNHSTTTDTQRPLPDNRSCPANRLDPLQRQRLAVEAIAGTQPISRLADCHDVSRKFVYQQAHLAQHALEQTFAPDAA